MLFRKKCVCVCDGGGVGVNLYSLKEFQFFDSYDNFNGLPTPFPQQPVKNLMMDTNVEGCTPVLLTCRDTGRQSSSVLQHRNLV